MAETSSETIDAAVPPLTDARQAFAIHVGLFVANGFTWFVVGVLLARSV